MTMVCLFFEARRPRLDLGSRLILDYLLSQVMTVVGKA